MKKRECGRKPRRKKLGESHRKDRERVWYGGHAPNSLQEVVVCAGGFASPAYPHAGITWRFCKEEFKDITVIFETCRFFLYTHWVNYDHPVANTVREKKRASFWLCGVLAARLARRACVEAPAGKTFAQARNATLEGDVSRGGGTPGEGALP